MCAGGEQSGPEGASSKRSADQIGGGHAGHHRVRESIAEKRPPFEGDKTGEKTRKRPPIKALTHMALIMYS